VASGEREEAAHAEAVMGPLLVVFAQPGIGDLAHLLDRLEHIGIENLIAIRLS
jgi:hypothetical protein